jgi:hypothetical protein
MQKLQYCRKCSSTYAKFAVGGTAKIAVVKIIYINILK